MTLRSLCGRADLVRALARNDEALVENVADRLGYELKPPSESKQPSGKAEPDRVTTVIAVPEPFDPPELEEQPVADVSFWRTTGFEAFPLKSDHRDGEGEQPPDWQRVNMKGEPKLRLLSPWSDLKRRLFEALNLDIEGSEPDIDATIARLCKGDFLEELPRQSRRRWISGLQVIVDRSDRLVPFWDDQDQVIGELTRLSAAASLEMAVFHEGMDRPKFRVGPRAGQAFSPRPGSMVLVLGDLGCLRAFDSSDMRPWFSVGQQLRTLGCRAVALVPCPAWRLTAQLRSLWHILPWEREGCGPDDSSTLRERAEFLLCLISPAIRIEPGFLRAVRTSLGPGFGDAGTEADVWQRLNSLHLAASFDPKEAKRYREAFSRLKIKRQQQVLGLLRVWHQNLRDEVWLEEVLSLPLQSQKALPEQQDLEDARRFFSYVAKTFRPGGKERLSTSRRGWVFRADQRMKDLTDSDPTSRSLSGLAYELFKETPSFRPSDKIEPTEMPGPVGKERPFCLGLQGGHLVVSEASKIGSLIGHIQSANDLLRVAVTAQGKSEDRNAFWALGHPPSWAVDWAEDDAGCWVTFEISSVEGEPVTQKMRWTPPGRFLMGSPASEKGRDDDEGPRHEVTFAHGLWLFETPCTQALWQAVMGGNPSEFKGDDRPVENVSWEDAKAFIGRLNELLPGLSLDLPSEAEWEYACRAGTTTAYSYGDAVNADRMNVGESETTPVDRYPPNAWGLRDMHGNVREWCLDHSHEDYEGAPIDGSAWLDEEASGLRVMRGGSWLFDARYARAAYRNWRAPGGRSDSIGFRCARGQTSDWEAEPAGPASWRKAEPRHVQEPTRGAAAVIRLAHGEPQISHPLPDAPSIVIRSDREELALSQLTKPAWASSIGRDRFGLYARFSVEPEIKSGGIRRWLRLLGFSDSADLASSQALVTQTMRWIPPGRFLLGSPENEEGSGDWEGPRHEVTLNKGFWLFDTPCTQALWGVVTGENLSEFKSPDRPVESVTWNDVRGFIDKLNGRVPDLGLSLPSEAQWEYACRAGTTTSSYAGEVKYFGENNAPLLDDIAWYSGNSGVGFDLEEGHDSSDWKEKQYPHEKASTRDVGQKRPNAFGLHDMLGNVWEWCADPWHETYDGAPKDGAVWEEDKATGPRVVRGGSWIGDARDARAASRYLYAPEERNASIGFRCARGQA